MKYFRISLYFIISLITLITLSCGSLQGKIWDESVPLEQCSKIAFFGFLPKSYNQMSVNPKDFGVVTIPSGVSVFSGDVKYSEQGPKIGNSWIYYTFSAENVTFSCRLEAGKEYWAIIGYEDNYERKNLIWGIRLYEDKIKTRVGNPPKETLVGFIPFNPPAYSDHF